MTYTEIISQVTVLATSAAAGGLLWRWLGRWPVSYPLAKIIVGLFMVLEFILAVGIAVRLSIGGPFNPMLYLVLAHAAATVVVVVLWPSLLRLGGPRHDPSTRPPQTPPKRRARRR